MIMGKSLEDFQRQTDPRIHPSFLEMTPTNLMYCENQPPPPRLTHLIAVETTKIINILATLNCTKVQ